jgi:signal transduction histidine kinase
MTVALSELLANAIRNARTTAAVSATRDGDMMRFSVTDDGVGFSGPALKRFSRPLRRQGLGLSLALVEDVARAHGGHLTIDAPDSASA